MSRRSNGEGSIFQNEKTGKWVAQVTYYTGGKRRRKTKTSRTRADANSNLRKLHEEIEGGTIGTPSTTVAAYLVAWLKDVKTNLSEGTYYTYSDVVKNHISPQIGSRQIEKLTPLDVQNMLNTLKENGTSSQTVQQCYRYLNQAMRRAYKFRMIRENPCTPVEKPKHKAAKANPFTLDEVQQLLEYLADHWLYPICYTALTTGMRPGELFGLHWESVNLDSLQIDVVQQMSQSRGRKKIKKPKTESSIRTIHISQETADVLTDQRKTLVKAGHASSEFVFCGRRGIPYSRSTFARLWTKLLEDIGLTHRGFHQMRHTFATLAIGNGVPITVVSETLGHASTSMTLDIYAHVLSTQKSDATVAVSKLIG